MSYDIYCYKSKLDRPDLEEAQNAIEVNEETEIISDPETKRKIAKALTLYNPRLESFDFDYQEIAKQEGTTIDEAKKVFSHIELNTPEGDFATQITIFDNNVSITVPYWYSGDNAREVFDKIYDYTKVIRQTAGYFVYDPQIDKVFDPLKENIFEVDIYKSTTEQVDKMRTEQMKKAKKKLGGNFGRHKQHNKMATHNIMSYSKKAPLISNMEGLFLLTSAGLV